MKSLRSLRSRLAALAATAALGAAAPALAQPAQPAAPAPAPPATAPAPPAPVTPAPAPPATPPAPVTPAPAPTAAVNPAAPAGPALSMAAAVARAEAIQPTLAASRAQAEAASARIEEARAALRPILNGTAAASISTHTPFQSSGPTSSGDPTATFDLGARATWLLTDFGRTDAKVRAAAASYEATKDQLATSGLDVRTNVESAYLQAVAERELVRVARAAEATALRHLDEAHRFVVAGAQDPITEATAAATAASSTAARVATEGAYRTAIAQLRLAMGDPSMPDDVALDAGWPDAVAGEADDRVALVQAAMAHRPELAGLAAQIDAADASLTAARYGKRPSLSAGAIFDWPLNNHAVPDPVWTASVTLSVPIFDGGLAAAQTREAEANKAAALASRQSEALAIEHDVESAWVSIQSATATLASSEAAVTTAHQQLALAEGRFAQGVGSAIELADAQNAVTSAEGARVSAQWQLATARTQLRRALGQ